MSPLRCVPKPRGSNIASYGVPVRIRRPGDDTYAMRLSHLRIGFSAGLVMCFLLGTSVPAGRHGCVTGVGPWFEVTPAAEHAGPGHNQPEQHHGECSCVGTSCCSAVDATASGHAAALRTRCEDQRSTVASHPVARHATTSPFLLPFATAPPASLHA